MLEYDRMDFWFMTKSEAVDEMKNADLDEKGRELGLLKKLLFIIETSNNYNREHD